MEIAKIVSSLATDVEQFPLQQEVGVNISPSESSSSPITKLVESELKRLAVSINHLKKLSGTTSATVFPISPEEFNDPIFAVPEKSSQLVDFTPALFGDSKVLPDSLAATPFEESLQSWPDDQDHVFSTSRTARNIDACSQAPERSVYSHESPGDIAALQRQLRKHKKANEAFQETLREIGGIITAVAHGDLTMKVRMDTVELDSEITTFKRTINAMMDQLQNFASEVSRVAREVGTEGLLGGQARIIGVDGTWKELTDNGIVDCRLNIATMLY